MRDIIMTEEQEYGEEFLSPRRAKKRLQLFPRNNSDNSIKDDSSDKLFSSPKNGEKRPSVVGAFLTPGNKKRPSIFGRIAKLDDEDDSNTATSRDLSALLSPGLERKISSRDRRALLASPVKSMTSVLSSFRKNSPQKKEDEEDHEDGNSEDEDEDLDKVATSEDLMLLLCRELELISGDSDDDEADDEEYDEDDY